MVCQNFGRQLVIILENEKASIACDFAFSFFRSFVVTDVRPSGVVLKSGFSPSAWLSAGAGRHTLPAADGCEHSPIPSTTSLRRSAS
jgi:hypothetical protein